MVAIYLTMVYSASEKKSEWFTLYMCPFCERMNKFHHIGEIKRDTSRQPWEPGVADPNTMKNPHPDPNLKKIWIQIL